MTLSDFKNILGYSSCESKFNQHAIELLTNWDGISYITIEACGTECTPDDVLDVLHNMHAYIPFITRNGDFIRVPGASVRCGHNRDSVFYIAINLGNTRCYEPNICR